MRKFTFLLIALLFSFAGYSQFPTPGTESFESTTGPDLPIPVAVSPWTLGTGATGNQWAVFDNGVPTLSASQKRWTYSSSIFYSGSQSAFINRKQNGAAGNISEDYLATPWVTVPANGQLTFWTRVGFNSPDAVNYLVKVNTTAGTQTTLGNYTTIQTWDQTNIADATNITTWVQRTVDLSAYPAGTHLYLAFVRVFNQPTGALGGNSWYIDDVKLVQRCVEPSNQIGSNYTTTTANLSWTPNGSTSWEVEIVPSVGGTQTFHGTVYSGGLPYVATGLTPATCYVYYVRALCTDSNSNWVGPFSFCTTTPGVSCTSPITIPPTLPYTTSDNTTNYLDTYDTAQPTACTGSATNYMQGNDVFYSYTAATTGAISITMTPGATNSSIFVYQGCSNVGVSCLAGVANTTNGVRTIPSLNVTAGQTYIIVLSSSSGTQTYPYSLLIQQLNCPPPTISAVTAITASGATLNWTTPTSTSWEYVIQPLGGTVPTGSGITSTTTATPVTEMSPGVPLNCDTQYQFWVRANCGNGTFSPWSGPQPFTTAVCQPACGTIFTDPGGQFANYTNNLNVTYPIIPAAGNQVTVTFTAFNTQAGNDILKVYDGTDTSATGVLLGTYSGTTLPPAITSSAANGALTFVFTSNASTVSTGWIANVTCNPTPGCQKPILLTAPTANITYNQVALSWTQNPNPDTTIPNQWQVYAVPCGNPAPTDATPTTDGQLASTNTLFPYTGLSPLTCYNFYVRTICSGTSMSAWTGPISATTTVAPAICGGNFVDPGGIAANYPNNSNVTTTINPVNAGDQVTVTFTSFNTQLNNDILKVYDGTDTSATGILLATYSGVYTGAALPQITSSSPSGALTFVFTSNASTTAAGWLANVTCAPAPACQKPILLTAPAATVAYNQVVLSWTQPANPDASIPNQWEVVAIPCTDPAPSATTVWRPAPTNPFTYDGLLPLTCYNFYVRAVCAGPSLVCGPTQVTTPVAPPICGGNFVDPGGVAANYPSNITAATGTTVISPVNTGDQVTVTFTSFNTQAGSDILKVYDGTDTSATTGILLATYSGIYTGTALPQVTSSSPDGKLTFVFTSDATTTAAGWLANVTCAPAPACQKPILLTVPSATVLSNSVVVAWNQTQNPDGSTPNQWQVYAVPCGNLAPTATTPTNFGATVTNATSTIYTGLNATTCYDFYVRSLCSGTSMSAWTGPTSATTALGCGGQFVNVYGATGVGSYPASSDSTVTICPSTPGDQVTVTFTTFATEATWDGLYVFDGNSIASPQIASANPAGNVPGGVTGSYWGTLTGANLPGPFTSSSTNGCLTFRFRSDTSVSTGGWTANITCAPAPTCSKPTNVTTGAVTGTSIVYNWNQPANPDGSTANSWNVITLPCGSPTPTATTTGWQSVNLAPGVSPTYTATGLTTSTCYDFYVMAVCSPTDSSPLKPLFGTNTTCGSQQAAPTCTDAPPVCLLQGYCGNTSSQYAPPHTWTELTNAFSTCLGGASIENNSFINFQATSTSATFNLYVYNSLNNDGVQFFAFEGICNDPTVTPKGCALVAPTGQPGTGTPVTFTMTGLVPGNSYHLMFDGYAGDVCDYQVIPVNGVFTAVDVTPSAPVICQGQSVVLTASGGNNTYTWSPSTGLSATTGTTVTANPTTTTTYTVTSSSTSATISGCAISKDVTVTVKPLITPLFTDPAPICAGTPAPVLPTSSNNTPPITGTWPPVSNTASATYTFIPDPGQQCLNPGTINVTVNTSCTFGSYASAVWLANCATSNFFNTVGSGTSIIGPVANVFPNSNLGTYVQNSSALQLKGGELKTYKNAASNVCSARLNYRVFPQGPASGTFQVIDLPFFSDCGSGTFNNGGGPCSTGDQKWQKVLPNPSFPTESPVDLTTYPPGNYVIQVYYDISGSASSTSGCNETYLIDNNGAYYSATFTIQATPTYASTNPTTCSGTNGTITISGLAPNSTYGLTYNHGSTVVGPTNVTSNASGSITINGLNAATYSNFLLTINSCSYPNNTPIVLIDPAVPTVTVNNATVCAGQSATITATPGTVGTYSYAWTTPGTNPGNVDHVNATVAGTYSVVITDTTTGCSSASGSGTLTVNPIIVPTFNAIAPICKGTPAPLLQMSSTNIPTAVTGTWLPSVIDNTASGAYVFTPDAGQCSQSVTINVTVNSVPTPTATLVTAATCAIPTATVDVTPHNSLGAVTPTDLFISEVTDSNYGSLSYVEIYNGTGLPVNLSNYSIKTAINGSTTYSFTLPLNNVILASGSNYVVALGNDSFCSSPGGNGSLAAQTSVSGSVNFASNGNDHFALFNGTTKIDTWGSFGSNNWAPSGIGTEGADFRRKITATVPSVTYNNNDWDVTDYAGTGISNCANNDYSNIGVYTYPIATSYQYNVDNGIYLSDSTFTGLTPGLHTFTIQDTNTGCISDPVSITISLPVLNLTVTVNSPTVCQGTNADVAVTPTQTGNYTYTWTYPSGATDPGNVDHFTAIVSGNYRVTITDNTIGCTTSPITSVVTINPIPTVTVNSPTVCLGASAVVTATATSTPIGTYSYAWTYPTGATDPGNVDHFTATISGNYGVTITDSASGCISSSATSVVTINPIPTVTVNSPTVCLGASAVVTATATSTPIGTYSYTWTYPTGASDPGNVDHFTAAISGSYGVIITDSATGCTSVSATSVVTINPIPTVSVNSPTVCQGFNAIVTATPTSTPTGTYSYTWTYPTGATDPGNVDHFTATISGSYGVTITDSATGCTSVSATSVVTINTIPSVTVNNPTVCQGTSAVVTATPASSGTYTYTWTPPTGVTDPGNVDHFTASVSGIYSIVITNNATGCTSVTASSTVTINVTPVVTVTGDSVCQGVLATISTSVNPTGTYNYVWTVPSGAINPGNVSTFGTSTSGTYSVIATDSSTGCSSVTQSAVATISPAFDFTLTDECLDNNFTVSVVPLNNTFDPNNAVYTWQVGGVTVTGETESTFNITHYMSSITPAPTLPLTVTSIVKFSSTSSCTVTHPILLDRIYCDIQRGISPNPTPDGKNDFFDLRLMNVQHLDIFNRYGTKVYSKTDYTDEWVGQSDAGNELPDGTYYYVIEFKNNQPTKTGWIYINRETK